METHPTEMSQGENDREDVLQHLISTIGEGVQKTEMSEWENDQYLQPLHAEVLVGSADTFISPAEMSPEENNLPQPLFPISFIPSAEMEIHLTDLEKLARTVAQKIIEGTEEAKSPCIYKVPEDLQKLHPYTPYLIAIGPLHQEDKHLPKTMQQVKLSYTKYLLSRLAVGKEDQLQTIILTVLQDCLAEMKASIDNATKCYAEEVILDEKMMLIDGCFILEFLYRCCTLKVPERDPIFCNRLTFCRVQNDLALLENQIPFFVLEKLFQLTVGQIPDRPYESLLDYVGCCYRKWMSPLPNSDNSSSRAKTWCSPREYCVLRIFGEDRRANYYHILHILHDGRLLHDLTEQKEINYREMPSASELVYAGVKFVPYRGNDLFNFNFIEPKGLFWWCRRARFEIPPLEIYDEMESYLRNLIAFEQSCTGIKLHFSSYAHVMDTLVNTDKDIQALEEARVLTNCLGAPQDATNLFNNLCKEICAGGYFLDTCCKATKYSKCFWPKNMVLVKRKYFASPWTFIAFCVGFIVFIMTVLQFVHDFFNISG